MSGVISLRIVRTPSNVILMCPYTLYDSFTEFPELSDTVTVYVPADKSSTTESVRSV